MRVFPRTKKNAAQIASTKLNLERSERDSNLKASAVNCK